jgi:hypothetical protein
MDEIFLNYGNFPNEKLLLVYGFCVPQNPFDAVEIYVPISPADPLHQVNHARMFAICCGIEDVNILHPKRSLSATRTSTRTSCDDKPVCFEHDQ